MKVKKLKELLEKMDENATVVMSGSDHSYDRVHSIYEVSALYDDDSDHYSEDYGQEEKPEEGFVKVKVCVIG